MAHAATKRTGFNLGPLTISRIRKFAGFGHRQIAELDDPSPLFTGWTTVSAVTGLAGPVGLVDSEPCREDHDFDAGCSIVAALLVVDRRLAEAFESRAKLVAELFTQQGNEPLLGDRLPVSGITPTLKPRHHDGMVRKIHHGARTVGQQQLAEALSYVGHIASIN